MYMKMFKICYENMRNNLLHEKDLLLNPSRNFGSFIQPIGLMMEGLIFKKV
jgi:hypothetical protein